MYVPCRGVFALLYRGITLLLRGDGASPELRRVLGILAAEYWVSLPLRGGTNANANANANAKQSPLQYPLGETTLPFNGHTL